MFGRRTQVCGDEVVGVSAELVVRQADDEALDRAGRKHQQQDAANELEEAVQPLEDDANFEGDVEFRTRHGDELTPRPSRLRSPHVGSVKRYQVLSSPMHWIVQRARAIAFVVVPFFGVSAQTPARLELYDIPPFHSQIDFSVPFMGLARVKGAFIRETRRATSISCPPTFST